MWVYLGPPSNFSATQNFMIAAIRNNTKLRFSSKFSLKNFFFNAARNPTQRKTYLVYIKKSFSYVIDKNRKIDHEVNKKDVILIDCTNLIKVCFCF